jgi:hypothetical protein
VSGYPGLVSLSTAGSESVPHRTSTTEACAPGVGTPGAASNQRRAAYSLQ